MDELEMKARWRNREVRRKRRDIEEAEVRNECWWCKGKWENERKFRTHMRNCEKKAAAREEMD